jgi:hypothetical protein
MCFNGRVEPAGTLTTPAHRSPTFASTPAAIAAPALPPPTTRTRRADGRIGGRFLRWANGSAASTAAFQMLSACSRVGVMTVIVRTEIVRGQCYPEAAVRFMMEGSRAGPPSGLGYA